jgi:hypothetical protein
MSILDIPGCHFSSTGLKIDQGLDFNHWEQIGRALEIAHKGVQWWIGDWLAYGEREYKETYAQAVEVTGLKVTTLMNYAFVAKAIDTSRRREVVDFSTHADVAALSAEDQDEILGRAAKEGLPRKEVRKAVRQAKRKHEKPPDPAAYVHPPEVREWLTRYRQDLTAHEEAVPKSAAFLREMIGSHAGQVIWQAERTIEGDCRVIRKAAAILLGTEDEVFMLLAKRGYFMSDPDFEDRVEYMIEQKQLKRKPEEGKKETQRGSMREILLPVYHGEDDDDEDDL